MNSEKSQGQGKENKEVTIQILRRINDNLKDSQAGFVATNQRIDEFIQRLVVLERLFDEFLLQSRSLELKLQELDKKIKDHKSFSGFCPHTTGI